MSTILTLLAPRHYSSSKAETAETMHHKGRNYFKISQPWHIKWNWQSNWKKENAHLPEMHDFPSISVHLMSFLGFFFTNMFLYRLLLASLATVNKLSRRLCDQNSTNFHETEHIFRILPEIVHFPVNQHGHYIIMMYIHCIYIHTINTNLLKKHSLKTVITNETQLWKFIMSTVNENAITPSHSKLGMLRFTELQNHIRSNILGLQCD